MREAHGLPQTSQVHIIVPLAATHTHARTHARTRARARAFNDPLSRTTRVSQYQKGKTDLDFTEARGSQWQWHQLGHMQVCTSLRQITMLAPNHSVFAGRMPFDPSCCPTNSVEALKAIRRISTHRTKRLHLKTSHQKQQTINVNITSGIQYYKLKNKGCGL